VTDTLEFIVPKESVLEFSEFLANIEHASLTHDMLDTFAETVLPMSLSKQLIELGAFDREDLAALISTTEIPAAVGIGFAYACLIIEREIARRSSSSNEDEDEDENEEEEVEEVEPQSEEDEESGNLSKTIDYFVENYTYKKELFAFYFSVLERYPLLKSMHTGAVCSKTTASAAWDGFKSRVKSVLAFFGMDGVFTAIDEAAKRSPTFDALLKIIGTIAMPVLFMAGLLFTITRLLANPFQRFFRWLAKEFGIKPPGDDDNPGGE